MLVISLIKNLLIEKLGNYFRGVLGKLRLRFFTKKLKNEVEVSILEKYGDRIYYLDFDRFLIEQDVLSNIIKNFINQDILQYRTISQSVDFYLNLFIERYPKYKLYNSDLKRILKKYFEIIFRQLNEIKTPESQILCRTIREISDSIDKQLQYLTNVVDDNNAMLNKIANGNFRIRSYIETLLATSDYSFEQSDYFERYLFRDTERSEAKESLDVLLQYHKVVLTGEAGLGKTFEIIKIINRLCERYSNYQLIPVYIPLMEYEDSLGTLFNIIQSKMEPFCIGNSKEAINQLFVNNQLALFFDGIDDIIDDRKRVKFFSEANQLMAQYDRNFFFFTTRKNRYQHELGEEKSFILTKLDDSIIQSDLIKLGCYSNLPKAYLELFRNPLLYKIGKNILADKKHKELLNRTQIFKEYFENNYYKNSYSELSLHETLNLFGKFSYEYFNQSSFTYSEVDKIISSYPVSTLSRRNTIDYFINFGIFSISDRIAFSHKLFKEFCAAYYITNNLRISSDTELLEKLIYNEEWQEVVVFIAGLFSTIEEQDRFLDFVLQRNLPLYIECINSKNDLLSSDEIPDFSKEDNVERILSEIHKTYKFIVENYFSPISEQFEPFITENHKLESKIGIAGGMEENTLYYWFDIVDRDVPDVKTINAELLSQASQEYQDTIFLKTTQMVQHSTNLELSGLIGDSGRKIAIDIIKNNLKTILEKKSLHASNYILCELLEEIKNKLPWLKDIDEISLMSKSVRNRIDEILQDYPEVARHTTSEGVELFGLNKLLTILQQSDVDYKSFVMPGRDREYSESNGLVTNLYSTKRKIKIVETFFNFAEVSYLEMVKYNFPNIYRYFSKIQDMPYKLLVTYKDDERNPWIGYYHVAYSGDKNLIEVSLGELSEGYEKIYDEILQSYQSLNRVPKDVSSHRSAFSTLLFSRNFSGNTPLSDYVHKEIEKSLEEIFGKM
ncbi:NACHT domain-containing protein [Streptococcus sp. ST16]|uniref:NACHT domain-containing protein n=1 Tax=Streptococcus sp. ST16 TaxID=3378283 RepID=UPI0038D428CD